MAMFINTNTSSLNAQRNLMNTSKAMDTSYTRLASGLRINSAKDDAAGLQISNRLTSRSTVWIRVTATPTTVSPWRRPLKGPWTK